MIKLSLERVSNEVVKEALSLKEKVKEINKMIDNKTGKGNDFLGWTTYASELASSEIDRIKNASNRLANNCDVLLVIGIGGSYLGARACIDAINGIVSKPKCEIIYLGNTLSPTYTAQVIEYCKGKKVGINVISKSGTTTEPAIALRLATQVAKTSWGDNYNNYIVATTDKARGALFEMSMKNGYETFVIPDDVGGRYSVFTPVGLIPMCVAGLDISAFLNGAIDGIKEYSNEDLESNEAYKYAAIRYVENKTNKNYVEFLISYEPHFAMLAEWWKQLYGESEGKENKGLLPGSLCFSTDLHSMGQFCQEGTPCFFETTISVSNYQKDIEIPYDEKNFDGLNYLANKKLSQVEDVAMYSTLDAHSIEGHHDNLQIILPKMDEYNLGKLMYMFCKACAMSAYMLDVNPFNQPGVEIYKARMKKTLKEL